MSENQTLPRPNPEFAVAATGEQLESAAEALRSHGIQVLIASGRDEARRLILAQLPDGAQVHQGASVTLETLGVTKEIEQSGRYNAVRPKLRAMNRETQMDEMRRLAASPDYMLGSVHAVTEDGSLMMASATGSQIGPHASGAGKTILAVGSQKIVPDLETALRRLREYVYPLEDERMQKASGAHSAVNQILIINGDRLGRITVILIDEILGF